MTEAEACWLAGFLDGEGCVRGKPYAKRNISTQQWILKADNTVREALEYCQTITGTGGITSKTSDRYKVCYCWQVQAQRDIDAILRQVRPYLRVKGADADIFLRQFQDVAAKTS